MHILLLSVLLSALLASLVAEKQIQGALTGYGWCDNDPPGNEISKPGTFHFRADQGDGSYDNPSTCAADPKHVAYGTRIYIPHLQKYCIVEDLCGACVKASAQGETKIDLWIGVEHGCGNGVEGRCEARITRLSTTLYIDANRGHAVKTQRLFDGTNCDV